MNATPQRLKLMTKEQLIACVPPNEEALDKAQAAIAAAIAAAVQAVKDEYAKTLPLTIKTAIKSEREACERIARTEGTVSGNNIAAAIRARNEVTK